MQQPLALLSFALIAAQFMLMLAFARNRRMRQVMASNALLLLAVLTLSVTVWDMDRERYEWGAAVARQAVSIGALTRLRDRAEVVCQ
jgi:hypothetical protein